LPLNYKNKKGINMERDTPGFFIEDTKEERSEETAPSSLKELKEVTPSAETVNLIVLAVPNEKFDNDPANQWVISIKSRSTGKGSKQHCNSMELLGQLITLTAIALENKEGMIFKAQNVATGEEVVIETPLVKKIIRPGGG
jgi:hypothetical protein